MVQLKKCKRTFGIIFIICVLSSFFPVLIQSVEASSLGLFSWNHSFTRADLALYWAPVWYQDTHTGEPSELDYITNFNFDGNWKGIDNWDNLYSYPLKAYIYFSVVETTSHWFIGYYDFHPRDWTDHWGTADMHENDMEGVLLVVTKTGDYGSLLLMETQAHGDQWQYSNEPLADGTDDVDGDVESEYLSTPAGQGGTSLWNYHPIVFVEDQGHGVHGHDDWNKDDFPGNDGVIYKPRGVVQLGSDDKYYPEGIAEEPSDYNDRDVGYALIDIGAKGDLWDRRFKIGDDDTYGAFGKFRGDDHMDDSANPPWGWDDGDDGPTFTGEVFYNPADMVDQHLNGLGEFDHDYIYNPYCIRVTINTYLVRWDRDGSNDLSDGYLNLHMVDGEGRFTPDDGVLDGDSGSQFSWIGWDFSRYTWVNMSDRIPRSFYGIHYPGQYYFGFKSRDWDPNPDDWLMGDYNGGYHDEDYLHTYGSELREGMHHFDWGGSAVWITLAGDVGDDDEEKPYFIPDTAYSHPELVPSNYSGSITFGVSITDASGISEAMFEFKGENDQNWTREQATLENNPINPDGTQFILRYSMEQATWTNYNGQTIYFRWWAMDNDDDRPEDALDAYSLVYEGSEIEAAPEPVIPLWMIIVICAVLAVVLAVVILFKRRK